MLGGGGGRSPPVVNALLCRVWSPARLIYIAELCIVLLCTLPGPEFRTDRGATSETMEINKDLIAASSTPLVLAILAEGDSYGYAILKRVRELSGGQFAWTDGIVTHRKLNMISNCRQPGKRRPNPSFIAD